MTEEQYRRERAAKRQEEEAQVLHNRARRAALDLIAAKRRADTFRDQEAKR
jgi:hypothetical protein